MLDQIIRRADGSKWRIVDYRRYDGELYVLVAQETPVHFVSVAELRAEGAVP